MTEFVMFSSAGAVGTAAHYLVLLVLVHVFSFPPVFASIQGSLVGAVINYLLSYHWVFRSKRQHLETATKFLVIGGVGLALNAAMMYLMVTLSGLHYLLSQVITTGIVLLWNFSGNRLWTFARESK